jgi:hypothetical protein
MRSYGGPPTGPEILKSFQCVGATMARNRFSTESCFSGFAIIFHQPPDSDTCVSPPSHAYFWPSLSRSLSQGLAQK